MKTNEIIKAILEESDFATQMKMAELVGTERLAGIVEGMRAAGVTIPHVMDDIVGTMRARETVNLAKILEKSDSKQVQVLVQVSNPKKILKASELIKNNPAQAHLCVDYAKPAIYKESQKFVEQIEKTGVSNYKLAQKMVQIRGVEETENDIRRTEEVKPVKHIVADVMGPLRARNTSM